MQSSATILSLEESDAGLLTRAQRAALVELMLLVKYADGRVTLAEQAQMERELSGCVWVPGEPAGAFLADAMARVRRDGRALLGSLAVVFDTSASQRRALAACEQVARADGLDARERALLARLRNLFRGRG